MTSDLRRRTIEDFGEQWLAFRDNPGYYGSVDLLADFFGPLLPLASVNGSRVAEIGSGSGRIVNMLLDAGAAHVVALEPSDAMTVLRENTADRAQRITYVHDTGDSLSPGMELDLVVSIGVLHHIPDPLPVVAAGRGALRPGGQFLAWLYGREGNEAYLRFAEPLRKITTRLPHSLLVGLSGVLSVLLDLYIVICRWIRLPMHGYMRGVLAKVPRRTLQRIVYDQLNPAYARYYSQDEAARLLADAGFVDVTTHHRHGYSWTVIGRKAVTDPSNVARNRRSAAAAARRMSMLAEDALIELARLASLSDGPIVELGPYIGGSTCALAAPETARVVTVEIGGANREHPQLPTEDTIADLEANLAEAGVRDRVSIVVGHFGRLSVFERVRDHLNGQQAGMLFVDVTPGTEIAIQQYASLLRPDAYVVIDDYHSDQAVEKAAQVRAFVDRAVQDGLLNEIGVHGWGTWFGRLTGGEARERIRKLPVSLPLWHAGGHAWHAFVGHDALGDEVSGNNSPLELLEDDRQLGPAHTLHDTIRTAGNGSYSHWRGGLYFSTSDNSNPHTNGRRYHIRVDGAVWDLRGHKLFP